MSLERLKLLTASTPPLERGSGHPEITWEDISGALAKAKPLASLYARICFAGNRTGIRKLEKHLHAILINHPDMQAVQVRVGVFRSLVRLSIIEAAVGQQFPVRDSRQPADKVRLLHLSNARQWYRHYASIYSIIQDIFGNLEQSAKRSVWKHISD
jgi:hypothetical protein